MREQFGVGYKLKDYNGPNTGQTSHYLHRRVGNHVNHIGNNKPKTSGISNAHTIGKRHPFDFQNSQILTSEKDFTKRTILEMRY